MTSSSLRRMGLVFAAVLLCARAALAGEAMTSFQSSGVWRAELHLPIDVAMFYGVRADGIKSWADHGYETWSMFGASWLSKNAPVVVDNPQIAQRSADGSPFEMIPGRAWIVPVGPWIEYSKGLVDQAIAGGAKGILPEEPEFFVSTGYSDAFKQAWRDYYGEEWRAPNMSLENNWKANKLKAHLFTEYYRAVFGHAKSLDPAVKCVIPTHSNPNYADWNVVAPHHEFISLPHTDGMIAQVWTGTAKHPHFVGGESFASVFDYSRLEFGFFDALTAGTGKDVWFLNDPVEDEVGAAWTDLRNWFEQTLIASLMFPNVNKFEAVPWPPRVFISTDTYGDGPIPEDYATELFTVWTALGDIPAGGEFVFPANDGAAFLTSDSLMWQRGQGADRFHGFAAPMLAAARLGYLPGVLPVERFGEAGFPPANVKVVVASFDAWKPARAEIVERVAQWVKGGGVLFFIGGIDNYDDMKDAWWNEDGGRRPVETLLDTLGLNVRKKKFAATPNRAPIFVHNESLKDIEASAPEFARVAAGAKSPLPMTFFDVEGARVLMTADEKKLPLVWEADAGAGKILYAGFPGEFVARRPEGPGVFMALLEHALRDLAGVEVHHPAALALRRGRFLAARGLGGPARLDGVFIDLLRPESPVLNGYDLLPGGNAFLLDIDRAGRDCGGEAVCVIHASGFVTGAVSEGNRFSLTLAGPENRVGYVWLRIAGGRKPMESGPEYLLDEKTGILRVTARMSAAGKLVEVNLSD